MSAWRRWRATALHALGLGARPACKRMGKDFRGVVDANISDIPAIIHFELPIFREHRAHHPQDFHQPMNESTLTESYTRLIHSDDQGAAVYVSSGETIGYVAWALYDHYETRQVLIHSIAVQPEHRSTGVGRALLHHAARRAAERGAKCIRATIWAHNETSRAFFMANDFGPVSEIVGKPINGKSDG